MNNLKPPRVWHKKKKKMFKVLSLYYYKSTKGKLSELLIQWDEPQVSRALVKPQEVILLMPTGSQDKNGTEIYEGDVVKGDLTIAKVIWNVDGFIARFIQDGLMETIPGVKANFIHLGLHDWEIIGNIYENPDLLREKK